MKARPTSPQPTPGQPIKRWGLPSIWATHIAKLLGGNQCVYAAWFASRYRYEKCEEEKFDLVEWNREHNALVRRICDDLRENGWSVAVEDQNRFELVGATAIVSGKPDIIASMPGYTLIIDAKIGKVREADAWQVLLYAYALKLQKPALFANGNKVKGEVHYKSGEVVKVRIGDIEGPRGAELVEMVKRIAATDPPPKAPSRPECRRCNISAADCPERVAEEPAATSARAAGF